MENMSGSARGDEKKTSTSSSTGNKEKGGEVPLPLPLPLPTTTSPYTQYKDLEDYKRQGYGTEGHMEPKPGLGAANSTDAPTDSVSSHAPLPTNNSNSTA